jgi:hypothetical protein
VPKLNLSTEGTIEMTDVAAELNSDEGVLEEPISTASYTFGCIHVVIFHK